jgi:PhnB protein
LTLLVSPEDVKRIPRCTSCAAGETAAAGEDGDSGAGDRKSLNRQGNEDQWVTVSRDSKATIGMSAQTMGFESSPVLIRGLRMTVKAIPDGYNVVTPYLMVSDASKFIEFMATVFGAETKEQLMRPDGKIGHTELCIGDSMIMLSEASDSHSATPVMLHFYVEDVDAVFERAVRAGGTVLQMPTNQFYGDRSGGVKEPTGNTVWIATHIEDVAPDEIKRRAAAMNAGA